MNNSNKTKIRVTYDPHEIYSNKEIDATELIDNYLETVDDETTEFILTSTIETALDFIADAWCLKYEWC